MRFCSIHFQSSSVTVLETCVTFVKIFLRHQSNCRFLFSQRSPPRCTVDPHGGTFTRKPSRDYIIRNADDMPVGGGGQQYYYEDGEIQYVSILNFPTFHVMTTLA